MEVVPGELSGHVDDLTVLTPSSLLYRGLPRKSSDQREGGESISRPSILGPRPPSSSTPHKRAPPHRLFCHLLFLPLPPYAYNLASAKSTSNLLSRIDFLSFYFPLFFLFLSRRDRYPPGRYQLSSSSCRVSFHYSLVSSSFKKGWTPLWILIAGIYIMRET